MNITVDLLIFLPKKRNLLINAQLRFLHFLLECNYDELSRARNSNLH